MLRKVPIVTPAFPEPVASLLYTNWVSTKVTSPLPLSGLPRSQLPPCVVHLPHPHLETQTERPLCGERGAGSGGGGVQKAGGGGRVRGTYFTRI